MHAIAYAYTMFMKLYRYWRETRNGEAMKSANFRLAKMGWPQKAKRIELVNPYKVFVHLDDGGKATVSGKEAAELTNLLIRY